MLQHSVNLIGSVMVTMLTLSVVDWAFEPQSSQIKTL
jgi:hypothetical protein